MSDQSAQFVMVNTPNGPRIIKVVEPDQVNPARYHWTAEQLNADYVCVSANSVYEGYQFLSSLPQYELRS